MLVDPELAFAARRRLPLPPDTLSSSPRAAGAPRPTPHPLFSQLSPAEDAVAPRRRRRLAWRGRALLVAVLVAGAAAGVVVVERNGSGHQASSPPPAVRVSQPPAAEPKPTARTKRAVPKPSSAAHAKVRAQAAPATARPRPARVAERAPRSALPRARPSPVEQARAPRRQVVAAAHDAVRLRQLDLLARAIGGGLGSLVAALGRPDRLETTGTYCHASWLGTGLTMVLVSRSSGQPCRRGRIVGGVVTGHGWQAPGGLVVGASLTRLRRGYPASRRDGSGWWTLPALRTAFGEVPLHAHVSLGRVDQLLLN